jgi:DNA-binding response OmpR family regulator
VIRPTVLLISGVTESAAAFQRALEEAGLSVRIERDGLNGMRQALDDPPDLVVLDFAADEAPDVLRSRRALRQVGVPLLVLASGEVAGDERPAREADVSFLAAPVRADQLATEARQIIERRARTRERADTPDDRSAASGRLRSGGESQGRRAGNNAARS